MDIRPFTKTDDAAVIRLWERCELSRPWNDPHRDIRRKLAVRPDLFLVGAISGEVVGSVMVGYDGHRGWINYLAVDPDFRKRGFGRLLMAEAELRLLREGCPKVNLQVRSTNPEVVAFYQRLGYEIEERVSMGKRLIADEPASG